MKNLAKHAKFIFSVMVLISPALVWQNCGKAMHTYNSSSVDGLGLSSQKIRRDNCASCHNGQASAPEPKDIMDDQSLIAKNWIIPGNAAGSIVYQSLFTGMPKNAAQLSQAEIDAMAAWINDLNLSGAHLTITDAPKFDFGSVTIGVRAVHTFTVINTGRRPATDVLYDGLIGPYAIQPTSTCGATINPGTPCTIDVSYLPTDASSANDTLNISYNDGVSGSAQILSQDVTGIGTTVPAASLRFAVSSQTDFGVVTIGSSQVRTLTVENIGLASASQIAVGALSSPFSQNGGTCGSTLAAASTCTVIVKLAPTSAGSQITNLTVSYNSGASNQQISIPLKGIASGGVTVYYSEVRSILDGSACNSCHTGTFGNWGNTYAALMAFKHPSSMSTAAILSGNANSRFIVAINSGTPQGHVMGEGGYGILSATNKQKIMDWIIGGALNDPAGLPANLTISEVSPVDFGNLEIGLTNDKTFTVTNSGEKAANTISGSISNGAFAFKGGTYPGSGGTCGSSLAVGANCTVVVRFTPVNVGAATATLTLNYNDSVGMKAVSKTLQGTGVGVAIAQLAFAAGTNGDIGSVVIGSYASKTVTLQNTGAAGATDIAISVASPTAFLRTGGTCATTLNAADSCTISVRFEPSAQGNNTSTLTVSYKSGATSKVLTLGLSGLATLPPAQQITFAQVGPILQAKCSVCHAGTFGDWGGSTSALPIYSQLKAFSYPAQATPAIIPNNANSRFILAITPGKGTPAGHVMGGGTQGGTNYGSLTADEVKTIRDWILGGALNATYPSYFVTLMADRNYVTSVMRSVFNNHATAVSATNLLLSRSDLRGSPCYVPNLTFASATSPARLQTISFADDRCDAVNTMNTNLNASMNPSPNTVAEATRIAACAQIIANTGALSAALTKSGLSAASNFDETNVNKAYQSFYVDRAPSAEVTSSLINIGQEAKIKLTSLSADQRNVQGWRFIYLALCQSTGWQVH